MGRGFQKNPEYVIKGELKDKTVKNLSMTIVRTHKKIEFKTTGWTKEWMCQEGSGIVHELESSEV